MRNRYKRRSKVILGVLALVMLVTLTVSVTFVVLAQTPCQSYNDQGQCIAWGGAAGYSSYQSWLDWQEYFACVDEATAKNNDDDEENDVDVDDECDEPDTPIISGSGGGTSSTAASD